MFWFLCLLKNLDERPASDSGLLQHAAGAAGWLGGNPLLMTKFQLEISCFGAAARTDHSAAFRENLSDVNFYVELKCLDDVVLGLNLAAGGGIHVFWV